MSSRLYIWTYHKEGCGLVSDLWVALNWMSTYYPPSSSRTRACSILSQWWVLLYLSVLPRNILALLCLYFWLFWCTVILQHSQLWLLQHISRELPFWNRTEGRDHIFTFAFDEGSCIAPRCATMQDDVYFVCTRVHPEIVGCTLGRHAAVASQGVWIFLKCLFGKDFWIHLLMILWFILTVDADNGNAAGFNVFALRNHRQQTRTPTHRHQRTNSEVARVANSHERAVNTICLGTVALGRHPMTFVYQHNSERQ